MTLVVTNGSLIKCSFGLAPSPLTVIPSNTFAGFSPLATIMDNKPMLNIKPFAMCTSLMNPAVTAATAAALGVLTPQPCMPMTFIPWVPPCKALKGIFPVLTQNAQTFCLWGGIIKVLIPGQFKTFS